MKFDTISRKNESEEENTVNNMINNGRPLKDHFKIEPKQMAEPLPIHSATAVIGP